MRSFIVGALGILLAGCGGGSGPAGGGATSNANSTPAPQPSTPASTAALQISATSVSVAAYAANSAPLAATLAATIVSAPQTPLAYHVSGSGKAVASSSFTWQNSQSGSLTISFPNPAQLGAGAFEGTVVLSVCLDAACTQPIMGSPVRISVAYVVQPGSQPPTSFTIQPAGINSPLFTSQTSPILADLPIYVTNFPSSGLWLKITRPLAAP